MELQIDFTCLMFKSIRLRREFGTLAKAVSGESQSHLEVDLDRLDALLERMKGEIMGQVEREKAECASMILKYEELKDLEKALFETHPAKGYMGPRFRAIDTSHKLPMYKQLYEFVMCLSGFIMGFLNYLEVHLDKLQDAMHAIRTSEKIYMGAKAKEDLWLLQFEIRQLASRIDKDLKTARSVEVAA